MDLIAQWLGDAEALATVDEASISLAREAARDRGAAVGLDDVARENLAAAVSELARNQLRHAFGGAIGFRAIARGGVPGLEIIAADRGTGIADPTLAFSGATRIAGSLGVGVGAAYRLAHELDIDVRWGEGTCVAVRTFAAPVARSELAVLARACRGESISGDQAIVRRREDEMTLAVVDGLGHGVLAREPADAAIKELARGLARRVDDLAVATDAALTGTRGVVMAAVRLDVPAGDLDHAGVGNITTRIVGATGKVRILPSIPGVLGGSTRPRRPPVEHASIRADDLVVIATDGLMSRVELEHEAALLRRPPILLAHHLVAKYGRPDDDVLVVVAR